VADGRFEGFWELWLAPWDIAAGTLIIREAGGVVTTLEGDPDVRAGGGIVAGNPRSTVRSCHFSGLPRPCPVREPGPPDTV
jgi:fructose-1,6-bisphosphatase/inositol monophosphatase family enzyme